MHDPKVEVRLLEQTRAFFHSIRCAPGSGPGLADIASQYERACATRLALLTGKPMVEVPPVPGPVPSGIEPSSKVAPPGEYILQVLGVRKGTGRNQVPKIELKLRVEAVGVLLFDALIPHGSSVSHAEAFARAVGLDTALHQLETLRPDDLLGCRAWASVYVDVSPGNKRNRVASWLPHKGKLPRRLPVVFEPQPPNPHQDQTETDPK